MHEYLYIFLVFTARLVGHGETRLKQASHRVNDSIAPILVLRLRQRCTIRVTLLHGVVADRFILLPWPSEGDETPVLLLSVVLPHLQIGAARNGEIPGVCGIQCLRPLIVVVVAGLLIAEVHLQFPPAVLPEVQVAVRQVDRGQCIVCRLQMLHLPLLMFLEIHTRRVIQSCSGMAKTAKTTRYTSS